MGVKVTNINNEFCETVPILDLKREEKNPHKNATPGMDMRSSPKNGYKISPLTTVEKQKKYRGTFQFFR